MVQVKTIAADRLGCAAVLATISGSCLDAIPELIG
jgi:hypothetical protein